MKVIGKVDRGEYICTVSHCELEKFKNLYYGKMNKLEIGEEIDLSKGYDHCSEIKSALNKIEDFFNANKTVLNAITTGLIQRVRAEKEGKKDE